jgi:hypothetical protein
MTEAEWLACDDPQAMLAYLGGKASERKLRLFACACCRRVWHLLIDEQCRVAVEVAERYADGLATRAEAWAAAGAARAAWDANLERDQEFHALMRAQHPDLPEFPRGERRSPGAYAEAAACEAAWGSVSESALWAAASDSLVTSLNEACAAGVTDGNWVDRNWEACAAAEAQCHVLYDIVGNPFRPPQADPDWLAWNGGTVPRLAQIIYEGRAFDRVPVLADALEDAGCSDAEILDHLRGPGPHVRGCWAVDLLLGKE